MKKLFGATVALSVIAIFISSAQAINLSLAVVQNGLAVVEGDKATKYVPITWENNIVGSTSRSGRFSFSSVVPPNCVGVLSIGTETIPVALANCTPTPEPTGGVFKTGQTASFAEGDDGNLGQGVASPTPRFIVNVNAAEDNGAGGGIAGNGICDGTEICNGTVTDDLTGLTWPRDLDCVGGNTVQTWANALAAANTLAHGNVVCGLADGSVAGDWRLPNRNELASLLDLGTFNPALPAGHPFISFAAFSYWTSTTIAGTTSNAWLVGLDGGFVGGLNKTSGGFVTAVRGGY